MPEAVVTIVESKQGLCLDFAVEKTRSHLNKWLHQHDIEVCLFALADLSSKYVFLSG